MAVDRIANTDFQSLHELKLKAKGNAKDALPEVAKQFEGIFLQSLLKTMRSSNHFLDEANPFRGKDTATFQEMLDGQYISHVSKSTQGIGIAELLTKQLSGKVQRSTPANTLTIGPSNNITASKPEAQPAASNKPASEGVGSTQTASIMDNFIKSIWDKAKQAAAVIGLDPRILVAQAALETGWGQSIAKDADGSTSNNLFNIKSGSNTSFDSVKIKTTEYIADTPIKVSANFRKYPTVEESFNDYISLIKGSDRYQNALAHAGNPERYVNELSKAGYATDPQYGTKILSIYHSDELNEAMERCGLSNQQ